jgi:hypothetical protein
MRSAINLTMAAKFQPQTEDVKDLELRHMPRKVRITQEEYEHILQCQAAMVDLAGRGLGLLPSSELCFPLSGGVTASLSEGSVWFLDADWQSASVGVGVLTNLFEVKFASVKFVTEGRITHMVPHTVTAAFVERIVKYVGALQEASVPGFHVFPMVPTDMAYDACHFEPGFRGEMPAGGRAFYLDLAESRLGTDSGPQYNEIGWVRLAHLIDHFNGEFHG